MFILNKFCRFLCILLIIFTSLFNVFISVPRIYMTYYYWNSENILYSFNEPSDCYFNQTLPIALCSYKKHTNTDIGKIPYYYYTHHPTWSLFDFLSNTPIECTQENMIPIQSKILSYAYCQEITSGYPDIGCFIRRIGDSGEKKNLNPSHIDKNRSGIYEVKLVVHEDTFDEKDEIIMMERIIKIFPNHFQTKGCFIDYVDNNTIIMPNLKEFGSYKEKTIRSSTLSSRDSYFTNQQY